jgi:hypothetical protein
MESTLIWAFGFLVGFMVGIVRGRRSIVREAQELVAQAIMEIKEKYETKKYDERTVHRPT